MGLERAVIVESYTILISEECDSNSLCALQFNAQASRSSNVEIHRSELSYKMRLVQSAFALTIDWFKEAIGRKNGRTAMSLRAFDLDSLMNAARTLLEQALKEVRDGPNSHSHRVSVGSFEPTCIDLKNELKRIQILQKQFEE